jgi:hypothetical protein
MPTALPDFFCSGGRAGAGHEAQCSSALEEEFLHANISRQVRHYVDVTRAVSDWRFPIEEGVQGSSRGQGLFVSDWVFYALPTAFSMPQTRVPSHLNGYGRTFFTVCCCVSQFQASAALRKI